MQSILERDTVDTFTLGGTVLIAVYVLGVLLLIQQYQGVVGQ